MRILTLHLYTQFTYGKIPQESASFSDIEQVLQLVRSALDQETDKPASVSEIVLLFQLTAAGEKLTASNVEIAYSCPSGSVRIAEGDYLFCQFSDHSQAGVEEAFEELIRSKDLPAGSRIILRLVNEAGESFSENQEDYAFQFLSPLS